MPDLGVGRQDFRLMCCNVYVQEKNELNLSFDKHGPPHRSEMLLLGQVHQEYLQAVLAPLDSWNTCTKDIKVSHFGMTGAAFLVSLV